MRFMTSGCGKWADPYCEESKAVQLTHNPRQFQQGQFIIRLVGRHTEPLLKKIWVAEPALMGSTYTSAHQQAPSTMACLYGQGAQCCWGKVTNTCGVTRCGDGHYRRVVYGLGPYIADYPEQALLACIVQDWCAKCTAPSDNLDGPIGGRRSQALTDTLLEGCTLKELWDDYGIVGDVILVFKGSVQSGFLPRKRATVDRNRSRTDPDIEGTEPNHLGPVFCGP
ncbi:uncharacterized protein LACBIDRAFT_333471 [Laccaria bicolor S238N-H82]|uniref:Predicted protein n=1 Tax=Laccaria bicolor (strain S238N-H82 / ATCC MYA-4686) TaxID=486041 RepID=B0DW08_LACBS|nr:uncharacterized protein LACBIDRAFT_333471 [Laccaria bicolor S238N-H82]EDR01230.1 predicted protein [Laccaria bicolor S238N-H82]|eukprot:XP_001888106.1 predicted protein [Laccaria bicolor S238N-H82]